MTTTKDVEHMTDDELETLDTSLKKEVQHRKDQALKEKRVANAAELKVIAKHKDALLELLEHDRTSCSDKDPQNGFDSGKHPRCSKCALMELLEQAEYNTECEWEIQLSVMVMRTN